MRPSRRRPLPALALLPLAGCSTTPVDIAYGPAAVAARAPAAAIAAAGPVVAVGTFADRRGEAPNRPGSIRDGFGFPIRTVTTPEPVSEVVRDAFASGLAGRGLLVDGPGAPYALTGTVQTFDATRYARREATAKGQLTLTDTRTGRVVLARPFDRTEVDGGLVSFRSGIFGSVEELRAIANRTPSLVVDEALDSPAFRQALTRP